MFGGFCFGVIICYGISGKKYDTGSKRYCLAWHGLIAVGFAAVGFIAVGFDAVGSSKVVINK
jgi:hypothetical protein